jgi:hypothetical protein
MTGQELIISQLSFQNRGPYTLLSLGTMNCLDVPPPVWRKKVAMLPAENQWWHNSVREHFNSEALQLEKYFETFGLSMDVA